MAGGEHEAVAVRPDGVRGVEAEMPLPEGVDDGGQAIGVPGWPEFACCTASMDSVRMVFTQRRSRASTSMAGSLSCVTLLPGRKPTSKFPPRLGHTDSIRTPRVRGVPWAS